MSKINKINIWHRKRIGKNTRLHLSAGKRIGSVFLITLLVLTGCGGKERTTLPKPSSENLMNEETAAVEVEEIDPDYAEEQAEAAVNRMSLDDKLELMVSGYENIGTMYRYFPGDQTMEEGTPGKIPECRDSLMTLRSSLDERYSDMKEDGNGRVMMSLEAYPKVTAMITPAFMSYEIVTSLLRTEMGFEGVVYTPPLNDARLSGKYPKDTDGYLAIEAVKAGCDVIYQPQDRDRVIQALRIEVNTDNMSVDRIDLSAIRVMEYRILNGLEPAEKEEEK